MSGDTRRELDDAMARQSGEVSEDIQPVATDEDADTTAQSRMADPATAERTAKPTNLGPE